MNKQPHKPNLQNLPYQVTKTIELFFEEMEEARISELEFQFNEKCSEMSFDELENYFNNCLEIYHEATFQEINKRENVSSDSIYETYSDFFEYDNPIPLDQETYNLLLKILTEKQREGFVDDWKQFIQEYLFNYFKNKENLESQIEIKDYIDEFKKENFREFSNIIKEARKEKEKWQENLLNTRKEEINYYQVMKDSFFGVLSEKKEDEILAFDFFPKCELTTEQFIKNLKNNGIKVISKGERSLREIERTFDYKKRCVGKGDFKSYVVYRFNNTNVVIAEKPSYGNATYLIKGTWDEVVKILQLSRGKARSLYPNQVKRVIHNDEEQWLSNLKFEFEYWD